jgi:glycosyltransferase involved in cell wall biosynthesis
MVTGMSRILMVSPYAPYRDGIAAYALQEVRALRAAGHQVEVLSPGPSAAHHHLDLAAARGPYALAKRVVNYDELILQYHPDFFYARASDREARVRTTLGLLATFSRAHRVDVRLHEFLQEPPARWTIEGAFLRRLWRAADRITVHTATERDLFCAAYGMEATTVEVINHGSSFIPHTRADQAQARARLGLHPDRRLFVSIGFIQPHKGFDRAVRAFAHAGLATHGAQLHVVGSVRVSEPHYLAHRDELAALVAHTPGVEFHEQFVSDEQFDLWLVAADVVVLPYRHIWSSGVLERARIFGRAVIASRVGGLEDQAGPDTTLVDNDEQLTAAMRRAGTDAPATAPISEPWDLGDDASLSEVMAAVKRRADLSSASE